MLLLAIPALAHLALGLWIARTLFRSPPWLSTNEAHSQPGSSPDAVCLVAARNEETSIARCLETLRTQSVPVKVVVINDHSQDATAELVRKAESAFDGRLLLMEGGPGKALALAAAVDGTTEQIILTTDADCQPPAGWASSMVEMLDSGGLAVLAGCTMIVPSSFMGKLEALDWAVLLATSAALSESGVPVTAMGNNMAMRRAELAAVGGFRWASDSVTEDYALFRAIGKQKAVELRMAPELINWTEPTNSIGEAFRQRRRWALGGLDGTVINRVIVLGSVFALAAPLLLLGTLPLVGIGLILSRWAVTAGIALATERRLGISLPKWLVPLHDLLLATYVILVPITILFSRTTNWKDRPVGGIVKAPNSGRRRDSLQG